MHMCIYALVCLMGDTLCGNIASLLTAIDVEIFQKFNFFLDFLAEYVGFVCLANEFVILAEKTKYSHV